jgi:outer membrane biosynthesis protein TonB
MKVSASRVRFVLEAAFLVVVAAVCYEAHLSWRGIVPAMAVAWALVTLVERTAMRDHSSLRAGRLGALFGAFGEHAAAEPQPASEPAPSHVTVLETAEEHPPEPQPEPMPAPEPVPPAPEPEPPTPEPVPPAPTLRPLPAPPEPALEAPLREPAVAYLPRRDGAEREWNVWELEQIAHAQEGEDAARDQELAFLLLELRQFADADGRLSTTFDPVIRESFGELLYTAV